MGTKEAALLQRLFQFPKLIVDPIGVILDPHPHNPAIHVEVKRVSGIDQVYAIGLSGDNLLQCICRVGEKIPIE